MTKTICVYIGGRANYSSAKSIMLAIQEHNDLELQVLIGTASVVDRYGDISRQLEKDGFCVNAKFYNLVEGENPLTMAKTAGLALIEASTAFDNLSPDIVLVIGDRYDVLPIAISAIYMNILLAHTMGGEVTGTIDESIRHSITKLAHIHFPANQDSFDRIVRLGENRDCVYNVGCPRNDLIKAEVASTDSLLIVQDYFSKNVGVGPVQDLTNKFFVVSQHPVTTDYGNNDLHMTNILEALSSFELPTILLWPNSDAGSDEISRAVRKYRELYSPSWLQVFKDLPVQIYIHLLNTTACLIGNSSSGIREGSLLGSPVVNIGSRQNTRLCSSNVITTSNDPNDIKNAISYQLTHGKYPSDSIYGDGTAGVQIANILSKVSVNLQKTITY